MMTHEDVKLSMEDDKLIKAEGSASGKRERENQEEDLPKLPSFSLELNANEITEDLFAVTGKLPSRRMSKRETNVQKQIDLIYPGGCLETITVDRYNVSRNNKKAKLE